MVDFVLHHGFAAHQPGFRSGVWQAPEGVWNIGYTISGTVREILAEGETWEHPHDFMILKPGGSHAWEVPRNSREPWRVVWFIFVPKLEWIPWLDLPEEFPRFSRIPMAGRKHEEKIRRSLLQAKRFADIPDDGEALAMNAIERALLWLQTGIRTADSRIDERVQVAKQMFLRQLANPPSVPEVAQACGLSHSRLAGLFRRHVGLSPQMWLERVRLDRARDMLLTTGLPVKLVAAACGYDDQRHFATRFRKRFNLTPGQLRHRAADTRKKDES